MARDFMKIAILGAGNVGGTLGARWAKNGHMVTFGVRNPTDKKMKNLLEAAGPTARGTVLSDAVKDAEVVVLATPWPATQEAIKAAGNLAGKIVVDCTNPLKPDLSDLEIGHTTSAGEQVAGWAKGARVVKAFNTTGAGNMANPRYGADRSAMFVCGDDAPSKAVVSKLAEELGFEVVDSGPLTMARHLEPLAMVWLHMAVFGGFGSNFAFKIMRR